MPGCIVSATTASFRSVEKRRRRATPVMTSTFENVSDIGVCLGLYLGPPAKAGVRSKRGAVHLDSSAARNSMALLLISMAAIRQRQIVMREDANFDRKPRHRNGPQVAA